MLDLRSVLLHEVGHILGLEHDHAGVMAERLAPGQVLDLGGGRSLGGVAAGSAAAERAPAPDDPRAAPRRLDVLIESVPATDPPVAMWPLPPLRPAGTSLAPTGGAQPTSTGPRVAAAIGTVASAIRQASRQTRRSGRSSRHHAARDEFHGRRLGAARRRAGLSCDPPSAGSAAPPPVVTPVPATARARSTTKVGDLDLRRLAVVAAALVVVGSSCSSADDDGAGTIAPAVTLPSEAECQRAALDAVAPAQAFIDAHEQLTVDEWNALRAGSRCRHTPTGDPAARPGSGQFRLPPRPDPTGGGRGRCGPPR